MQFHLVHNDEVVEVSGKPGNLTAIGFQEQVVGKVVNRYIAEDSSLGIKQETVIGVAFFERLDGIRYHAVEPADPVVSANAQKAPCIRDRRSPPIWSEPASSPL